jgi:hypothetical protein
MTVYKRPTVLVHCACGDVRVARRDRVTRGEITACAACALSKGRRGRSRLPEPERQDRERFSTYRSNAKRRQIAFKLSLSKAKSLFVGACAYCGERPALGIDRLNSSLGYIKRNVVPCCWQCNSAKKVYSVKSFLTWIKRVHNYQKLLQRKRSVCGKLVARADKSRRNKPGRCG